jgi:hypothetical protein
MNGISHPSKQMVRAYLASRTRAASPPPSPEEIRRQLGWGMATMFQVTPLRTR